MSMIAPAPQKHSADRTGLIPAGKNWNHERFLEGFAELFNSGWDCHPSLFRGLPGKIGKYGEIDCYYTKKPYVVKKISGCEKRQEGELLLLQQRINLYPSPVMGRVLWDSKAAEKTLDPSLRGALFACLPSMIKAGPAISYLSVSFKTEIMEFITAANEIASLRPMTAMNLLFRRRRLLS